MDGEPVVEEGNIPVEVIPRAMRVLIPENEADPHFVKPIIELGDTQ